MRPRRSAVDLQAALKASLEASLETSSTTVSNAASKPSSDPPGSTNNLTSVEVNATVPAPPAASTPPPAKQHQQPSSPPAPQSTPSKTTKPKPKTTPSSKPVQTPAPTIKKKTIKKPKTPSTPKTSNKKVKGKKKKKSTETNTALTPAPTTATSPPRPPQEPKQKHASPSSTSPSAMITQETPASVEPGTGPVEMELSPSLGATCSSIANSTSSRNGLPRSAPLFSMTSAPHSNDSTLGLLLNMALERGEVASQALSAPGQEQSTSAALSLMEAWMLAVVEDAQADSETWNSWVDAVEAALDGPLPDFRNQGSK